MEEKGPDSILELISKFMPEDKQLAFHMHLSIKQLRFLFDKVEIIQNPVICYRTLFQTEIKPILSRKFCIFILEFEVPFTPTLAHLSIAV